MVLHKYKITWKGNSDIEFVTSFMKDFQGSLDEVQRVLDVLRLISEQTSYRGKTIVRIEEIG